MMTNNNPEHITRSNRLDVRDGGKPSEQLHDDRYVIDELRGQIKSLEHKLDTLIGFLDQAIEHKIVKMQVATPSNEMARLKHEVGGLHREIAQLREELQSAPIDQRAMFPQASEIIKIKAQIFHNTGKGRTARVIKFYVWTCPATQHDKYLTGTCGEFKMNLADPKHRSFRRYNGTSLDYLDANDAKLLGSLSMSRYAKRKFPEQAAIIMPDNHLYLELYGVRIDCGAMHYPQADWKPGANQGVWVRVVGSD